MRWKVETDVNKALPIQLVIRSTLSTSSSSLSEPKSALGPPARPFLNTLSSFIVLPVKLVYPAFRLARETREFTIVLFQHDGFSLHFLRREEMWLARIASVVQEEIAQHGVETRLEW